MWRSAERADLEKKPSTRLSQEPCLGVKISSKRPAGCAAKKREQRHAAGGVNGGIFFIGLVHSKGFATFGAGAVDFLARAIKSARACAGFCHSCAASCIEVSIGKRTMPRGLSTQPGLLSDATSFVRI